MIRQLGMSNTCVRQGNSGGVVESVGLAAVFEKTRQAGSESTPAHGIGQGSVNLGKRECRPGEKAVVDGTLDHRRDIRRVNGFDELVQHFHIRADTEMRERDDGLLHLVHSAQDLGPMDVYGVGDRFGDRQVGLGSRSGVEGDRHRPRGSTRHGRDGAGECPRNRASTLDGEG